MKKLFVFFGSCLMLALCVLPLGGCTAKESDPNTLLVNYVGNIAPSHGYAEDGIAVAEDKIARKDPTLTDSYLLSYSLSKYTADKFKSAGKRIKYVNWGWDAALVQKQTNSLRSSGANDAEVYIGDPMWLKNFVYMNGLTPFPDDLQRFIVENMLPAAYSAMTVEGKIYGVNVYTTPMVLYVNMDIAQAVFGSGYTAPQTWGEFIAQSEAVLTYNAANGASFTPGPVCVKSGNDGYLRNNLFFRQQGYDFEAKEKPDFNNENVKQTLKFLNKVCALNHGKVTYTDAAQIQSRFVNGESLFMIESSLLYKQYQLSATSRIKNTQYFPVPVPDTLPSQPDYDPAAAYSDPNAMGTMVCTLTFSVPKYVKAEKKAMAFDFIKAFCEQTPQRFIRDEKSLCATNKAVAAEKDFAENKDNATVLKFYEILNSNRMFTMPTFPYQNSKAWGQIGNAISRCTNIANVPSPDFDSAMSLSQAQLERYWQQG